MARDAVRHGDEPNNGGEARRALDASCGAMRAVMLHGHILHDEDMVSDPATEGHRGGTRLLIAQVEPGGARFALATETGNWAVSAIRHIGVGEHPTFLSALRAYADMHRIDLAGHPVALSVAGPVGGPVVSCTHGGWFIALRGLEALTRRPPLVINDASAIAWATVDLGRDRLRPVWLPAGGTDDSLRGRHAIVWLTAGLGVACIDKSDERITILDSEAAHIRWAPSNEAERALADRLDTAGTELSVEAALLGAGADDHGADMVRAGILGDFCRTVALSFGAWDGVLLGGPGLAQLLAGGSLRAFGERFHVSTGGTSFNQRLSAWRFDDGRDPVLAGVARCWRSLRQG